MILSSKRTPWRACPRVSPCYVSIGFVAVVTVPALALRCHSALLAFFAMRYNGFFMLQLLWPLLDQVLAPYGSHFAAGFYVNGYIVPPAGADNLLDPLPVQNCFRFSLAGFGPNYYPVHRSQKAVEPICVHTAEERFKAKETMKSSGSCMILSMSSGSVILVPSQTFSSSRMPRLSLGIAPGFWSETCNCAMGPLRRLPALLLSTRPVPILRTDPPCCRRKCSRASFSALASAGGTCEASVQILPAGYDLPLVVLEWLL